jgi:signal transduction histidine kinase
MAAACVSSEGAMGELKLPEPDPEVQRRLHDATSRLALHTRDLRRAAEAARRRTQELAVANARLRILDRLKTDFLSFISHELRTPLTHLAAIDMIDLAGDPARQAQLMGVIRNGYERLDAFIRRGLEYFQWLSAERRATNDTVNLTQVVQQVANDMTALARPGVDFRLSAPDQCVVRAAKAHLAQCVAILLDNAVKFSGKEKHVRVALHAGNERVILSVADQGWGFPPELADELFRPFTIADAMHHSQGTGLSLALASVIVQAYEGRMWATSTGPGTGATFFLELPAAASARR